MSVLRFRHYVAKPQISSAIFVQPLAYAYNTQVHRCIELSSFRVVFKCHSPGAALFDFPSTIPTDFSGNVSLFTLPNQILAKLSIKKEKVDNPLTAVQSNTSTTAAFAFVKLRSPERMSKTFFTDTIRGEKKLITRDEKLRKMRLTRVDWQFRLISVQRHTLTTDVNVFWSTVLLKQGTARIPQGD